MSAQINFDATTVSPSTAFEPVPLDWYRGHAIETDVKPTKNGAGRYLQITWEFIEGEHKGRKVWSRLNIENPSKAAQDIAQRELSAICHATGVIRLSNSAQLHHIPVMLRVGIEQGPNGPQNVVKGYKACEDNANAVPLPKHGATLHGNAVAGAVTPAPATAVPAWAKKAG